jgi:hypothetical protein
VEEGRQDQREQEGEENSLEQRIVSVGSHLVEEEWVIWTWLRTMTKLGPDPSPAFFFSPGLGLLFLAEADPAGGRHRKA